MAFYMVYMEGSGNPNHRHATLDGAETEAKRLSKLFQKKTYVLCTIKSFEVNEFTVQDCRPPISDELPF